MAKKANRKLQSVGGQLVSQNQMSKNNVSNIGSNMNAASKKAAPAARPVKATFPNYAVGDRSPAFLQMVMDPVNAGPALPPVSLPGRVIPLKQYTEVLLSTDVNGNAAILVNPIMASHYNTAATFTGTTIATYGTAGNNAENASFQQNFQHFIPLCVEVMLRFTGSSTNVAGRMYGIVGNNGSTDLSKFPLEPNGCEAITSDGISCTWYSTDPVWANPLSAATAACPVEWMDPGITAGIIGGPASAPNCITAGIWFHLAGIPKPGICGLTPVTATPDPSMQLIASLMQASTSGLGGSVVSAKNRDKMRKRNAKIKDVLKIGGKAVGMLFPPAAGFVDAGMALANILAQ